MFGYSPVLPLEINKQDGIKLTKSFEEVVKQNLLMVVLTNPGERIMFPDFGVGLKSLLFEQNTTVLAEEIHSAIMNQANLYLPYIKIKNIDIDDDPGASGLNILDPYYTYLVKIHYMIDFLGIQNVIEIEI